MCRSMVDIHSATVEIRRGKKKTEQSVRGGDVALYQIT